MAHYSPDLPFRVEHLILDVSIDPIGKSLNGTVTHRLRVVDELQTHIILDQEGLQVLNVSLDEGSAEFRKEGKKLSVTIPSTLNLKKDSLVDLKIQYRVERPERGLYFTGPDVHSPNKPYQVWSQGQDQDSHFWFPTFDYPNQRTTVEVIARVPEGYSALSNGRQISGQEGVFHYSMKQPIVVYLITLVVGKFVGWKDTGPRGLPVEYYVVSGREGDGRRSFANTPKMIEEFEKKIGVSFPYEKYSQVAVQDFIFGGMENASATTQTDLTLHDERAHLDFSSDPLVAHELAHQWFGDLVTCRDWSHAWLNEGFATFMERVWVECDPGQNGGHEEAKYYAYQELKDYLEEDGGQYRRSIVCNLYDEPIDLFDRHLYQKGGLVLNLVRATLGESDFWKSIRHYVATNQNRAVETIDLIRAIEEVTGRNLRRFFQDWVFSAGHPEFEVTYAWKQDQKLAELQIEQKQTRGRPALEENGFLTPLFQLPVWVEFVGEGGKTVRKKIELREVKERVLVPCEFVPKMVRFDPDFSIPKTLKFTRSREMLIYQLENDADCMGRIDAVKEISQLSDLETVKTLSKVLQSDRFWGVQAEAASALGEIRLAASREALVSGLNQVSHPKVRKAIVRALGTFKDLEAAAALQKIAQKDASYFVEAEATLAYASAALEVSGASSTQATRADEVEAFLIQQLSKPSYREVIRKAVFRGVGNLPGIEKGDRPRTLEYLFSGARPGSSVDSRVGAVLTLGEIANRATPPIAYSIVKLFQELADEDNFFIRNVLISALEASGLAEAILLLRQIYSMDSDGRVRRHAQWAIDRIQGGLSAPESVGQLKRDLEVLQTEYLKLKTSVEDLRAVKPG